MISTIQRFLRKTILLAAQNKWIYMVGAIWITPALGRFAITPGVCYSFKQELLKGYHDFTTDAMKIALFLQSSSNLNNQSTALYAANGGGNSGGEVTFPTGTYSQGGSTLSSFGAASVSISSSTAYVTWGGNPSWTSATITSDACLIYNSTTKNSTANRVVAIYSFGSTTSTAGTFTVVLPSAGVSATLTLA